MSLLDIALMLSVPVGTVALTVTWRLRKKTKRRRASRQPKLL